MPRTRRLAGGLLLTALVSAAAAAPAHAESYFANCMVTSRFDPTCRTGLSDWTTASRGVYQDETNVLCAYDDAGDGKSAIAVYWPKGKPGQKKRIWDHKGHDTKACRDLSPLPENAHYKLKACVGEWAKNPANRLITSCGTTKDMIL